MPKDAEMDIQPRGLLQFKSWLSKKSLLNIVMKAAAVTFFIKVLGLGLSYMSQVFLARLLGRTQFGIYAYAWTFTRVLGVFGSIGLDDATLRFLPQYVAGENWRRAAALLRYGWVIVGIAALIIALGAGIVVTLLGQHVPNHYVLPLWIGFGAMPFLALINLRRSIARCFDRTALAYIPRMIAYPVLVASAALVLSVSGVSLSATVIMVAVALVLLVIMLVQAGILTAGVPPQIREAPSEHELRLWLRVSFPLLLVTGFRVLLGQTSVLMLGVFGKPEDVALFFAADRLAGAIGIFLLAANALGAPRIASLYVQNRQAELQKLATGIIRMAFWPTLVSTIGLIFFGDILLGLFGPAFVHAVPILNILIIGILVSAAVGPAGHLLAMTEYHDLAAWIFGTSVIINIVLNLILIPKFGVLGAAVATSTSVAFKKIVTFIFVGRQLKIHSFVFFGPPTSMSN